MSKFSMFTVSLLSLSLVILFLRHEKAFAIDYKFPWAATVQWKWWSRGGDPWHAKYGSRPCSCAIDFATNSYFEVLSPADGQVASVCVGPTTINMKVLHDDGNEMWYAHLDKTTVPNGLVPGVRLIQGQLLGQLRKGDISEIVSSCPQPHLTTADQGNDTGHLHWQIPLHKTLVIDGWTLNYLSTAMEKDGQRVNVGNFFTSTNKLKVKDSYLTKGYGLNTPSSINVLPPFSANGSNGAINFKIY
jgi:murein DD-endopeptidase MepM/ murein hydrolase activator NlpD